MDVSKLTLLKGDARRQLEKYGRIVEFDNYPIVWYTGDGWGGTLCGPCAAEALAEYLAHHDDEDYIWCDGELPEHCEAVHEGPAISCDECDREIFEGYEECEKCGAWESTPDLTYTEEEGILCKKCKS